MSNNLSEILVIQDRSGSMTDVWDAAVEGFNGFISGQKKIEGEARLTAVFFDSRQVEFCKPSTPLSEVEELSASDQRYSPLGSTALLDTIGSSLDALVARIDSRAERDKPAVVIVVINTDGYENASTNYSHKQIEDMITSLQEDRNWQFIFMSANLDAIKDAVGLGIPKDNTMGYTADPLSNQGAYTIANSGVGGLRSSGGASMGAAAKNMGNWNETGIDWTIPDADTPDSAGSS